MACSILRAWIRSRPFPDRSHVFSVFAYYIRKSENNPAGRKEYLCHKRLQLKPGGLFRSDSKTSSHTRPVPLACCLPMPCAFCRFRMRRAWLRTSSSLRVIGKKESIVAGCCISVLAYVLMLILPITPDTRGLVLFVVCQLINSLGAGIGTCLAWSLMADATDYGEWKFGTREEGTTYSLHSFFRKLGQSIEPSLGLLLATWLGYDATLGASQTMEVATNMRYLVAFMYLLSAVIQLVSYGLIYNIDRKTRENMEKDLADRHATAAEKV